jgi:hypothetical protein
MDLAQFIAEAERLARRATLLSTKGSGEPVAYWHGLHSRSLCVSLRHRRRWLDVHLDDAAGQVTVVDKPALSSTPLFGVEVKSLPPVDAVFAMGSSAVESFLHENGWSRADSFNRNFPDEVPSQYERLWQENCPMYADKAAAICGGWHFPWPDGDFHDLIDSELVIWTLQESEPWIEVFAKRDVFVVKQRVT